MAFNYNKLRGRIKEICGTEGAFAESLGVAKVTLSGKLNGKVEFTPSEIHKSMIILKFNESDIPGYFFTLEVCKDKPVCEEER